MKDHKRLTLKGIAQQLGISVATLDRVLNNRGNVKPETYRKVMEKLEELEYTPNKSARFLSRGTEISFAIVFPEHPDYFWTQIERGIRLAYEELRDYGLRIEIFKSESYDTEKQRQIVQEIVDSGAYDALALSPNDSQQMEDPIDQAIDKGMAVCTFNNDAPLSKRLFYVGCDYRIAGRLAADMLCKLIGSGGRAGLITSDASSLPSATTFQMQQKITGFREVIAEQGNIEMAPPLKLKHEEYDHPDRFGEYFRQVDGIYVTSAKLHVIARHLEEAGLGGTVALIGHDMTEDIYQDLDRGTVTATICQDPVNQGYMAVKTLFNHTASGEKVNLRENISKLELVTRENARYYI